MRRHNLIRHAALFLLSLGLLVGAARAGEHPHDRRGLVLGFNVGGGTAMLQYDRFGTEVERELDDGAAGAVRIGYGVSNSVVFALEGRGFHKEDGPLDVAHRAALVTVTWHPGGGGFFLRGGVGSSTNTIKLGAPDHADWEDREGDAALIGLGYEWRLGRQFALGVALDAYGTEFEDLPLFQDTTFGAGSASVQLQWYL